VRLDELLFDALNDWLRPENVEIVYHCSAGLRLRCRAREELPAPAL